MIQEMMANYYEEILVGYLKAGLIGWIVWFIAAFAYIVASFGTRMDLYEVKKEGGKKLSFIGVLRLVLWPWGILDASRVLVNLVKIKTSGKEQNNGVQS